MLSLKGFAAFFLRVVVMHLKQYGSKERLEMRLLCFYV